MTFLSLSSYNQPEHTGGLNEFSPPIFDTAIRKAKEKETDMTDETNKMNTLIAACWRDDALKQRFLSDPHAVLAEHGMDVPEGINVNVVENTDTTVHVTLPAAPVEHADLSDEELANAAGGSERNRVCQNCESWNPNTFGNSHC
jgi:hypothetical protein